MRHPGFIVRGRTLALVTCALLAIAAPPVDAHPAQPAPGAADIGDPLFPGLGNGGYDVRHYTLDLVYGSAASVQSVPGRVRIDAKATQALSRFDLDYSGDSVEGVTVDRRAASFTRAGDELVITPARPIRNHHRFVVVVDYTSGPREIAPEDAGDLNKVLAIAWFATPSGSITAAQPNAAHRILPSNDVPSDPARYTFHAITPGGVTFVANGELVRRKAISGGRTRWTYEEREPMASELIQLAFGALSVIDRGSDRGVRLRDVVPTSQAAELQPALAKEIAHLDYMTEKVGRYPFRTYGSLASDATFPFALEDQTISLYPSFVFLPLDGTPFGDPRFYEPLMVHELAHQWFGDSVMPERWSDVWLNEGHATWYEFEYAQERGDPEFYLGGTFEERMRADYAAGDTFRALWGPVAAPSHGHEDIAQMFSPNVYDGGAVVLYALRQEIGDAAFRRLERRWVQRHSGEAASTADFIALASRVAHRDLTAFLTDWLYGTKTPAMPGHPDWTVDPAAARPAARLAPSHADRLAFKR
jgi:aminopeptidase N